MKAAWNVRYVISQNRGISHQKQTNVNRLSNEDEAPSDQGK